ncbi:MAG: tyrosine--tRNA ligase [bacterium]|nr:tyrosine--tRNA ligase [bacterium]
MRVITNPHKIDEILNRGTIVKILPTLKEFRDKLLSGQELRFYIGFDPTAPTLHLSHAKNFMLMEKFRKLGHKVIILFGDFTARIGDPSGELAARRQLSRAEVMANAKKWTKLAAPLMDFKDKNNPPQIKYNHGWLSKLRMEDLISLAGNFTVQQMMERDMFQKRVKEGKPIHLHEFLYPLMQGYDSVVLDVDVEVCGTDQIFNALVGRSLLKRNKGKDKYVVAVTLMENPRTGELMSKSKGIGVFLDAAPRDMYGQIMAQPDEMIPILFVNNTLLPLNEINSVRKLKPLEAKERLAFEIVKLYHGEKEAEKAKEFFDKTFREKKLPEDVQTIYFKPEEAPLMVDVLKKARVVPSNSEFRRLLRGRAIEFNQEVITDPNFVLDVPGTVRVGKKTFLRVEPN